jgi:repressor LexA
MKKIRDDKSVKILEFVTSEVDRKGYPPSVREICSAVGFKSTSTVHGYLKKLEKNGMIHKDPSKPRALRIMDNPARKASSGNNVSYFVSRREMVDIPIVGKVTAGAPILAVENITDTFPLPADYTHNSTAFMLRVRGESMIDAGILENDLVLVKQQSTAENGDIVVALIGDEATVKTFHKEKGYIRLQPENQYMEPIIIKDDIAILGKVIGVFRLL